MQNGMPQIMNKLQYVRKSTKKTLFTGCLCTDFPSYYAFIKNPRITSKGMNTSAIFGFLLTLREVLQKQKPTHIAVVFDTPHQPSGMRCSKNTRLTAMKHRRI